MEMHQVIKKILVTEKSTAAREESNKYFFEVDRRANDQLRHLVYQLSSLLSVFSADGSLCASGSLR